MHASHTKSKDENQVWGSPRCNRHWFCLRPSYQDSLITPGFPAACLLLFGETEIHRGGGEKQENKNVKGLGQESDHTQDSSNPCLSRRPDNSSLENSTGEGQTLSMEIRAPRRGLDRECSWEKSKTRYWRKDLEGGQSRKEQVPGRGCRRDKALGDKETPPEKGPWKSSVGQQK